MEDPLDSIHMPENEGNKLVTTIFGGVLGLLIVAAVMFFASFIGVWDAFWAKMIWGLLITPTIHLQAPPIAALAGFDLILSLAYYGSFIGLMRSEDNEKASNIIKARLMTPLTMTFFAWILHFFIFLLK